jgi:hypothetical protein
VARKPNYDFEKRQKEIARKAKQDAKREERERRKREGIPDDGIDWDAGNVPRPTEGGETPTE